MTSQENNPHPVLAYRSGLEEPIPPSAASVLAGLVWVFLGSLTAVVGLFMLGMGGWFLFGARNIVGAWVMLLSLLVFWASSVVFGIARRCFSSKPRSHPPQSFSRRSSRAMRMAATEATSRNSKIEAEHLLLGILEAAPNAAVAVLAHLNVDVPSLRRKLDNALGPHQRPTPKTRAELPPEPSWLVLVLRRAIEASQAERLLYVGTEHLLLGLVAESSAHEMLQGLDVDTLEVTIERLRPTLPNEAVEEPVEEED